MIYPTHLGMIFGNPYPSLQESPAISHWADNCGAWLPMPTVPGLYPRPQDAWETTITSDYFSFSRGNIDKQDLYLPYKMADFSASHAFTI